jgi:uncharacterized short protein YbdD (DUF466 family)
MRATARWLQQAASIVRRVIGAPDYDRYVAHLREKHPGTVPVSREQFIASCLNARYDKPGSRCC